MFHVSFVNIILLLPKWFLTTYPMASTYFFLNCMTIIYAYSLLLSCSATALLLHSVALCLTFSFIGTVTICKTYFSNNFHSFEDKKYMFS